NILLQKSMRVYPAVLLLARMIDKGIKIGEQTIPKGTVALAFIFYMHRHPKHFENPDIFMPERFLETKYSHTFQFLPLSAGPRNCIRKTL
ncbi:cytochrome P450, putative, partial [Ixodes scapularis]